MRFLPTISAAALVAGLTMAQTAAMADTVNASLWDKGGTMDMSKNMGMGMNMTGNMADVLMGIKVDKAIVKAGKTTFHVKNISKETIHEMILAPIKDSKSVMPFSDAENRVDEDKAGDLGEVSELDPGASGDLTVNLKPGTYLLYCNVPGHYAAGMWVTITAK